MNKFYKKIKKFKIFKPLFYLMNRFPKAYKFVESLLVALIAALFIRAIFVQAFKIPTGSMEDTLIKNDHLLANKFVYGLRIPFTNYHPFWLRNPYRGEITIFKFPRKDDVDFIKRCIGLPGEKIEFVPTITGFEKITPNITFNDIFLWGLPVQVRINGKILKEPYLKGIDISTIFLLTMKPPVSLKFEVKESGYYLNGKWFAPYLSSEKYSFSYYKNDHVLKKGDVLERKTNGFYYYNGKPFLFDHTRDHIYLRGILSMNQVSLINKKFIVPKKGDYINLDNINVVEYIFYKYTIRPEVKSITYKDKKVFIDGKHVKKYQLKNNTYLLMGDNRNNSSDCRDWGFINELYLNGKAGVIYWPPNRMRIIFSARYTNPNNNF